MTYALYLQLEGDSDSTFIADKIVRVAHIDEDESLELIDKLFTAALSALRASGFQPNELDT